MALQRRIWPILCGLVSALCSLASAAITIDETVTVRHTGENGTERDSRYVWTFVSHPSGTDPQSGQYACGSYWVAPANGDTGVTLQSLVDGEPTEEHYLHVDADPNVWALGLLYTNAATNGGKTYENNDPSEDDLPNLPVTYTPGAALAISLVASSERNGAEEGTGGTNATIGGAINSYSVITVLAAPPDDGASGANSIRPNIVGDTKEFLDWTDFDLTRITTHAFVDTPDGSYWASEAERWRHSIEIFGHKAWDGSEWIRGSEGGRAYRPHILHDEYAGGMARSLNSAIYKLAATGATIEQKKPLLAALIARGLDHYHFLYSVSGHPGAWGSGATQSAGHYAPTVLATMLLTDTTKADRIKKVPADNYTSNVEEERAPQEIRQILRGNTGVLLWGDNRPPIYVAPTGLTPDDIGWTKEYWANMWAGGCYDGSGVPCDEEASAKTMADPHGFVDGPAEKPGAGYMGSSIGSQSAVAAFAIMWPSFRATMNWDGVIEYSDRFKRAGRWTYPDPVAPPIAADENDTSCNIWSEPGGSNYGTNCNGYRLQWGPSEADEAYAVQNGVGRFVSIHGDSISVVYEVVEIWVEDWAALMALYDGETYEDWTVSLDVCVRPEIVAYPIAGGEMEAVLYTGTTQGVMRYTLDGTTPTLSSELYTGPISGLAGDETIKAKTFKTGYSESGVTTLALDGSGGGGTPPPTAPQLRRISRGKAASLLLLP